MKVVDVDGLRAKGLNISTTQLWRMIKKGDFPKPALVAGRRCWLEADVDQWITARFTADDRSAA